ncbi:disintegrin and metalloproteinase domain-containing protein 10 [Elysia marginata]|uniref:Disintegrin and metalloproteinase domain-containing protein 10 n=1 Tax=Elysia marginata TaxID=1093978 RepID=A0AAV4J6E1_9GAST|nr:disintegrin and metalloproteinase domain-containing protein 10 [Elysia marginata]
MRQRMAHHPSVAKRGCATPWRININYRFLKLDAPEVWGFVSDTKDSIIGGAFLFDSKINLHCHSDVWPHSRIYAYGKSCHLCKLWSHRRAKELQRGKDKLSNYTIFEDFDSSAIFKPDLLSSDETIHPNKQRRSINSSRKPASCPLLLVADHMFYKFVGNGNVLDTINQMLNLINRLDSMFRSTDFNGDGWADNIGFLVKRVLVLNATGGGYKMITKPDTTSAEYLGEFSLNDFSQYCLAIAFTFSDFSGTAGSAYVAYSDGSSAGGICQKPVEIDSQNISYNSIVLTYLLDGKRRTEMEVLLTLAHEIGHSFGAPHDDETFCSGTEEHGDFIMSTTTNTGYKANNYRFSECSLRNMLPVIKYKGHCLTYDSLRPQCGNGLPEDGEECDCGWSSHCNAIDPCCTPADETSGVDRPCRTRRSQGKLCSPLVSACCTDTCTYTPAAKKFHCNSFSHCSQLSTCDGLGPHCPQHYLPDGTACNGGLQVCSQGKCSAGVCEFHNLSACLCQRTSHCDICCKQNSTCTPLGDFISFNQSVFRYNSTTISLQCAGGNCSYSLACLGLEAVPLHVSFLSDIKAVGAHLRHHWVQYIFFASLTMFIVTALVFSCSSKNSNHAKSLSYGKMMGISTLGQHMAEVYDDILQEIDAYYQEATRRIETRKMPMSYLEALGRLKALFPDASVEYLSKIVTISATEEVAVKILIIQGFRMRTFSYIKI